MKKAEIIIEDEKTVFCDYQDFDRIRDEFWESFRLIDSIMLMIDGKGKILDISEAGARFLGEPREEIVGKNWFDSFIPERLRAEIRRIHAKTVAGGDPIRSHHNPVLVGDGKELELHWQNTAVRKGGEVVAVLSLAQSTNYTEYYRNATLRSNILDSALDKVLLTDLEGNIIFLNKVVEEVGGWPLAEMTGKSIFGTILEEDEDIFDYIIEKLKKGESVQVQLNVSRKDGSSYPAQVSARPVQFEEEKYATVVIRDIRQILAAQEALVASERRYKAYVENAKDVVFTLDSDRKITYISPQIENFGYSAKSLVGKDFGEALGESVSGEAANLSFTEDAPPVTFKIVIPGGRVVWFEESGRPILEEDGSVSGFVGTVREVTDRVESELDRGRLLESEREMAEIGAGLLATDLDSLGVVLSASLGRVCQIIGADGGIISEIEPNGDVHHTFQWVGNGKTIPEFKVTSLNQVPGLTEALATGGILSVGSLSEADDKIREELTAMGWPLRGKIIVVPYRMEDKPGGMVTVFGSGAEGENFADSDVSTVKIFSGLVGSVMINRKNTESLAREAEWDKVLSAFSAALLLGSTSGDAFAEVFRNAFFGISEMFGFNRAALYSRSGGSISVESSWEQEGLDVPQLDKTLSMEEVSGLSQFEVDGDILIENVEDLPDSARSQVYNIGKSDRLKSLFMVSLRFEGEFVGSLVVISYDEQIDWSKVGAGRIRATTDILTSAFLRRKAVSDLDKRLEVETAISEAVADLATARMDSLQFKAAQAMSRLAGVIGASGAGFYYVDPVGKLSCYAKWQSESVDAAPAFVDIEGFTEGAVSMAQLEKGEVLTVSSNQDVLDLSIEDDVSSRLDPKHGFICIPTHREGKLTSVLCLSALRETVALWRGQDLHPVRTFSDALFSSYARVKSDEAMKELERLRVKFIHVVSHQLRTPLNSIRWSLEALLAGELGEIDPEQKDFIKVVYDAELKIISRIRDMIIALDIEEGRVSLAREEGVMEALWGSVMSSVQAKADKLGVGFSYKPPSQQLPAVFVDTEKIRSVMESMANNALSYTRTGGTVEASLEREGDRIRFEVKDTGVGIPKTEQPEIFNRFFRASNASVMVQDASGLSLSIAKYYIDRHGGEIGFTSEQGKGSVFWFTLPIA